MKIRLLATNFVTVILTLYISSASAMTMKQFSEVCGASSGKCSDNPYVQAYVGGALDLIATLDERTDYLKKVYCKKPKELFDVPLIISYMEQRSKQYSKDNAMLVLVNYFEEYGGCKK